MRLEVRRETGKEQVVQVHYDEGVAIHIGPEAPRIAMLCGKGAASPLSYAEAPSVAADDDCR